MIVPLAKNQKRACHIVDKTIGPGLSNNAIIIFSDQTLSIVRGAKKQEQRKIWRLKVGAPRLTRLRSARALDDQTCRPIPADC